MKISKSLQKKIWLLSFVTLAAVILGWQSLETLVFLGMYAIFFGLGAIVGMLIAGYITHLTTEKTFAQAITGFTAGDWVGLTLGGALILGLALGYLGVDFEALFQSIYTFLS